MEATRSQVLGESTVTLSARSRHSAPSVLFAGGFMLLRSRRRSPGWALLLVFALALIAPQGAGRARAASDRPVMAFYYPWYEMSDWSYDRMSDIAAPKYNGGDDNTLRRHIQQAADAGIDALICTWYGPNEERLNKRCRRLLQLAEQSGRDLKVAIIPDQSAAFDGGMRTVEGLAAAIGVVRRDFMGSPAYLRYQGKPVLFFFNPPSLGDVGAWQALRDRADPNRDTYWFGGTDNFGYLDVYDALYYFDISWEVKPGAAMASYAGRLSRYNQSSGASKPFVATVQAAYDDTLNRGPGHKVVPHTADAAYYKQTWQSAIDRRACATVLTSFNEFFEGSYIEPSAQFGRTYLDVTGQMTAQYKTAP